MEKLTYNEFKEAIKDYFSKRMDHAEIQLTTNDTVNQKIDYLTIREKDATVSPSLRLNDSYKQYLDCKCEEESFFETIYEQVVNAVAKDRISFENLDNLFRDKDACKERVIMELINEKGNEELLQKVVSRDFCNLKVIYRLVIANDEDSVMSTIVTKSGMDYMHMSESELYDATLKNTKSFMKPRMIRMRAFGMCAPMDNEAYCVMGNNSAKNCAALIADPEYLQEIAEMIGTDYYIVPLGIEGFVVVPEAYCDVDMQKDALKGTNEASQKDKLFLSNDLYFYGSETGELSVVQ